MTIRSADSVKHGSDATRQVSAKVRRIWPAQGDTGVKGSKKETGKKERNKRKNERKKDPRENLMKSAEVIHSPSSSFAYCSF